MLFGLFITSMKVKKNIILYIFFLVSLSAFKMLFYFSFTVDVLKNVALKELRTVLKREIFKLFQQSLTNI